MSSLVPGGLLLLCCGLGATLGYEAFAPLPTVEAPHLVRTGPAPLPVTVTFDPPPRERFAIVNARPVFSPTRQPLADPAETSAQGSVPPDATLLGVLIGPGKAIALLRTPGSAEALPLALGQTYQGWRLIRIAPDRVVFHASLTDYELALSTMRTTGLPASPAVTAGPGVTPPLPATVPAPAAANPPGTQPPATQPAYGPPVYLGKPGTNRRHDDAN